jgi:hypothetical protein
MAYSKGTGSSVVTTKDEAFDPAHAVMSVASGETKKSTYMSASRST